MMDMSSNSSVAAACKLSMLWNWDTLDTCFLTSSWHVTTRGAFAASCLGALLLVVALEFLRRLGRDYDAWVLHTLQASRRRRRLSAAQYDAGVTLRASPLQQLARAVLHAATLGMAYLVMLLAMSYNGYVLLCIVLGAGLGKFVCDWMAVTVGAEARRADAVDDEEQEAGAKGVAEMSPCCE